MYSKFIRKLLNFTLSIKAVGKRLSDYYWNKYVYAIWKKKTSLYNNDIGNPHPLSLAQRKQIEDYWKPYIKKSIDTKSHQFYYNVTGTFDVRFIPDALYFTRIDKFFNNWDVARIIDNKTGYDRLFPNVLQPVVLLKRINGFWRTGEGRLLERDAAEVILEKSPVFMKIACNSEGGHGVYYIDKVKYCVTEIKNLINSIKVDIVVQEPISQSNELSRLNPSSVNTIRCLTLLKRDGTAKLYSTCLRMGVGDTKVDNASSGGCVVGVKADGTLNEFACTPQGKRFKAHPFTGLDFSTVTIPNFFRIKELVLGEATKLSYFRLVSWDIALNKQNEPVLIEANLCSGELDFHQLNNGPLFGDDTEEILNEVFNMIKV